MLFGLLVTSTAGAQQPATDADLRTTYCIAVVSRGLTLLNPRPGEAIDPAIEKMRQDAQDNLDRMRAYLAPKVSYLDPLALATASARGQKDAIQRETEGKVCFDRCNKADGSGAADRAAIESAFACVRACWDEHPVMKRTQACNKVDWLPF
jgi:hypothetical protein